MSAASAPHAVCVCATHRKHYQKATTSGGPTDLRNCWMSSSDLPPNLCRLLYSREAMEARTVNQKDVRRWLVRRRRFRDPCVASCVYASDRQKAKPRVAPNVCRLLSSPFSFPFLPSLTVRRWKTPTGRIERRGLKNSILAPCGRRQEAHTLVLAMASLCDSWFRTPLRVRRKKKRTS